MKTVRLVFPFLAISSRVWAQNLPTKEPFAHTYSIVAIDTASRLMGVAVQSHWFGVGNVVAWAKAGLGALATQSFINKSFGIKGLDLIEEGKNAKEALVFLITNDKAPQVRQVGKVDFKGNIANHIKEKCVDFAEDFKGPNYTAQSNMMLHKGVPKAMAEVFGQNCQITFAERLLKALEAAQDTVGEIREKKSTALRIVKTKSSGEPWNDDFVADLRGDDHENPLIELRRLLKVKRAYEHMYDGDLMVEVNAMTAPMNAYERSTQLYLHNFEMRYWTAINLANNSNISKAVTMLQEIYKIDPNWRELSKRLPKVGLLTVSE